MFDNPILHPRVYIYIHIGDLTKENVDRQKKWLVGISGTVGLSWYSNGDQWDTNGNLTKFVIGMSWAYYQWGWIKTYVQYHILDDRPFTSYFLCSDTEFWPGKCFASNNLNGCWWFYINLFTHQLHIRFRGQWGVMLFYPRWGSSERWDPTRHRKFGLNTEAWSHGGCIWGMV